MNHLERFKDIHTFIFDVDGVMTNSKVTVLENGHLLREMSVRDGYAMKLAIESGYRIGIITGGRSSGVVNRLEALGVRHIYKGIENKLLAFEDFCESNKVHPDGILYMGDDVPDYPVMRRVGMPTCPVDAIPEIRAISLYVSAFKGGDGCVRDVLEKTMKLQGKWPLLVHT
jgi:3-deoxy-D-manno-octulosonate 8-phosphate phosphatase (KDO 8-P phosphatase)